MAGKTKRIRSSSAEKVETVPVKHKKTPTKKRPDKTPKTKLPSASKRKSRKPILLPEPDHNSSESEHEPEEMDVVEPTADQPTKKSKETDAMNDSSDSEQHPEEAHDDADRSKSVDFANLQGVGEASESSDDDAPLETLELARLPGQVVSEIQNDEPALKKKLDDISIFSNSEGKRPLPFWESLTVTMPLDKPLHDSLALDDLKREQKFAELATASAHLGLELLRNQKVKFRRPKDYFAEMVKTDAQMGKVKAKILNEKENIESAEKRRNNRDIAKNKKKVRATQLRREQDKKRKAKEEIEAFSRLRKQRVKNRAEGPAAENGDDDFPIELLEVEQLDADNRFQPHSDIASGKRKPWTQKNDKFSKSPRADRGNGRPTGKDIGLDSGKKGKQEDRGRGNGKVGGPSAGIRKPKGSKKRLGRNRRKASGQ